jgi:hypothetical protein
MQGLCRGGQRHIFWNPAARRSPRHGRNGEKCVLNEGVEKGGPLMAFPLLPLSHEVAARTIAAISTVMSDFDTPASAARASVRGTAAQARYSGSRGKPPFSG